MSVNYVFLHGLAGGPENWHQTADYLKPSGAKCFTPQIEYIKASYESLEELAQTIHIPREYNPDDTILVGNSLGATLTMILQSHGRRIVLVAPPLIGESRQISMGGASFSNEIAKLFYDPNKLSPEQIERYRALWKEFISLRVNIKKLRKIKRMSKEFDYDSKYQELQSKTTLICGRCDQTSPLAYFEEMGRRHPQMTLMVLEECGHAIPLEKPKELADLLTVIGSQLD